MEFRLDYVFCNAALNSASQNKLSELWVGCYCGVVARAFGNVEDDIGDLGCNFRLM